MVVTTTGDKATNFDPSLSNHLLLLAVRVLLCESLALAQLRHRTSVYMASFEGHVPTSHSEIRTHDIRIINLYAAILTAIAIRGTSLPMYL
jgi:hypothetical protein